MSILYIIIYIIGGILNLTIEAKQHGWKWFYECNPVLWHQRKYPYGFPIFNETFTPWVKAKYITLSVLLYIGFFLLSWIGVVLMAFR